MAQDFGAANLILSVRQNLSVLKCESRTNPAHFWLYKKAKSKMLSDGSQSLYFSCMTCQKLGAEKGRVTVRNGRVLTDPEIGHNPLCAPMDEVVVETLILKRAMLSMAEKGQNPILAYHTGIEMLQLRFSDENMRNQVELAVPEFDSLRSSLYRSRNRKRKKEPNFFNMRGALIVFEGIDRCGKSTQADLLLNYLLSKGHKAELLKFPDRKGKIGKIIDSYLKENSSFSDEVIHLLFSADRWEAAALIRQKLSTGTTLLVDRYAFSGVAYSSSKGLDLDWCKQPDVGLPRPDVVFFVDLSPQLAAGRSNFGTERYEKLELQQKVYEKFHLLFDESFVVIDGKCSIDEIQRTLQTRAEHIISTVPELRVKSLWTKEDTNSLQ